MSRPRKQPQPLPLYRKIRGGLHAAGSRHHIDYNTFRYLIPFNGQVAANIFWCGDQDWYSYNEVGPLRLPFPAMWVEWTIPLSSKIGKRQLGEDHHLLGLRCGVVVTTDYQIVTPEEADAHNDGPGFDFTLFTENDRKEPMLWPAIGRVEVNDDGSYRRHAYLIPERFGYGPEEVVRLKESVGMLTTPLLIALGLINCRNVRTAEGGELVIPRRKSGHRHRYDPGPSSDRVRYHTIVLPGGAQSSGSNGDGSGPLAMHRVRGHFKTYTAEAPLLGKHVGTYWWGWAVRGNPEHGTVISDYSLDQQDETRRASTPDP